LSHSPGPFCSSFFFCTETWTQGLHLEPALFLWRIFWDRISGTICLGWLQIVVLLISASWVARITGLSHWCLAAIFQIRSHVLPGTSLGPWSSYLDPLYTWDDSISSLFVEMSLINILPGLVSNCDPPNLCFPNCWDYRCQPLYPVQKAELWRIVTIKDDWHYSVS
jgi:hypothetical protein